MRFSCIRSKPTVLQSIRELPFVNINELSATSMNRCVLFNEKLEAHSFQLANFDWMAMNFCALMLQDIQ